MAKPFLVVRILCALSWGVYYIILCLGGIFRANAIPLRRFAFLFITMVTRLLWITLRAGMPFTAMIAIKMEKLAMKYCRCEQDWLLYCATGYAACSIL